MTNKRARPRATTVVVIVSLLVITLPMLFDTPSLDYENFAVNGAAPLSASRAEELREHLYAPLEKAPAIPRYEDVVPASDVIDRVRQLQSEVDEDGFNTLDGTRFGEPVLLPRTDSSRVLAVFVSESTDSESAVALRDRLRNDGYEAFISTAKKVVGGQNSTENTVHRVAVGPLLSHTHAQQMQDDLSLAYQVQARVVEMSQ